MSDKQTFILRAPPHQSRELAKRAIDRAIDGYHVTIQPPTRTLEQNSLLWPVLGEISKQVKWYGEYLTDEN